MGAFQSTINNPNESVKKFSDAEIKNNINRLFNNNKGNVNILSDASMSLKDYENMMNTENIQNIQNIDDSNPQLGGNNIKFKSSKNRHLEHNIDQYIKSLQSGGNPNKEPEYHEISEDIAELTKIKNFLGGQKGAGYETIEDDMSSPSSTIQKRTLSIVDFLKGGSINRQQEDDDDEGNDNDNDNDDNDDNEMNMGEDPLANMYGGADNDDNEDPLADMYGGADDEDIEEDDGDDDDDEDDDEADEEEDDDDNDDVDLDEEDADTTKTDKKNTVSKTDKKKKKSNESSRAISTTSSEKVGNKDTKDFSATSYSQSGSSELDIVPFYSSDSSMHKHPYIKNRFS